MRSSRGVGFARLARLGIPFPARESLVLATFARSHRVAVAAVDHCLAAAAAVGLLPLRRRRCNYIGCCADCPSL